MTRATGRARYSRKRHVSVAPVLGEGRSGGFDIGALARHPPGLMKGAVQWYVEGRRAGRVREVLARCDTRGLALTHPSSGLSTWFSNEPGREGDAVSTTPDDVAVVVQRKIRASGTCLIQPLARGRYRRDLWGLRGRPVELHLVRLRLRRADTRGGDRGDPRYSTFRAPGLTRRLCSS